MLHLLDKISGWVQNGPMGNDKQVGPLLLAGVKAGVDILQAGQRRQQQKKMKKKKKKEKFRQKKEEKKISPQEARVMEELKKGAKEGSIDVGEATSQVAQPIYQQGEAQEAQAMGKMTAQGLEGSIIAQETSRKVGADVRAEVANQARSIAMQNEQTKAQSQKALQDALFKRGELMRQLAMKKMDVKQQAKLEDLQSQQQFSSAATSAGFDFALGGWKQSQIDPNTGKPKDEDSALQGFTF